MTPWRLPRHADPTSTTEPIARSLSASRVGGGIRADGLAALQRSQRLEAESGSMTAIIIKKTYLASDTTKQQTLYIRRMAGVRRTSVTVDAHALQHAGLIKYSRGKIQILDVDGLHDSACECYETVRSQYSKLLGDKLGAT
jgi:hypothetical protein